VQVQTQRITPRGIGHHTPTAGEQVVASESREVMDLIGQQAFYAGGARHEKL
jgi:hypothetical protein